MLLFTFVLCGGLNQIMFRGRLRFGKDVWGGLNSSLNEYPLFPKASRYGFPALSNTPVSDEISRSLLLTDSGMFLIMQGGWFDLLCT